MATMAATDYQMPIGGEWGDSDGGRFEVTNPATGAVVGTAVNATADDVRRAIDAAEEALGPWQALAALERGRILRRAADRILAEADHIAGVMTDEQGKPLAEAKGEVVYAASFLEWFAGEAERVYGMTLPPHEPAEARARAAPAGRRHGRDHALELPGRDDDAQARPGPRGGLHDDRQARLGDAADGARGRALHGGGRRARRRRQRHHLAPHRRRGERAVQRSARAQDLVHRLDRGRQGAHPRLRRPGQAPLARARRPRAVRRLRGRRHRGRRQGRDGLEVPQRRPDLRVRQPHLRAAQHPRRVRREARRPPGRRSSRSAPAATRASRSAR